MKRVFRNIFKIIIVIYLFTFLIIKSYIFSCEKLYDKEYPNIKGYSLLKVTKDIDTKIDKNSYLILKEDKYDIGDYIFYKGKNYSKIKDIADINVILDNGKTITRSDVYSKVIYNNDKVDFILYIITSPVFILIILGYILFSSNGSYKRF